MGLEEEIKAVEKEIRETPYNKASQHHIGKLKAKLSKLKTKLSKSEKEGQPQGVGYGIKKEGDATIVICGFPSVGKSTLLNQLTNAESKVAGYEFTTLKVIPGALKYKGAELQILDVPGLVKGASSGKGRGKEVLSVIRIADLILLVADAEKPEKLEVMKNELEEGGLRLNKKPPDVKIDKKSTGGIHILKGNEVKISDDEIKGILSEFNIHNADVLIRGKVDTDKFIDAVEGNRKYVSCLSVINKIDLNKPKIKDAVYISAKEGTGIKELKETIFDKLNLMRIYMKPQGEEPDFEEPLIIQKGSTIEDVCRNIHRAFKKKFRYAVVTGKSSAHENQRVGLKHKLKDEDILTLVLKE